MTCCEPQGWSRKEIEEIKKKESNRIYDCPKCGGETVDGQSVDICGYSPCICNTCGCRPCDGSC